MIVILVLLSAILILTPLLSGLPEEPLYSSLFCVLTMAAVLFRAWTTRKGRHLRSSKAELTLVVLLGVGALSILVRVGIDRNGAYLGPMLRAGIILATEIALFALCRRMAQAGRFPAYLLLLAIVLAAAIVGGDGVAEHFAHVHQGDKVWRVFAYSTPDFTAGYLAMLLPPTLALLLGLPWRDQKSRLLATVLPLFLLVVFTYEALTLLWTSSRFALVSLVAGLTVMGLALVRAHRGGLVLERAAWKRLAVLLFFLMVIGLLYGGAVIGRLRHTSADDNSTQFRLYVWRGAVHMAAANPLIGTGLGTWAALFPHYSLVGFTRLAHNSYLQMVDECGIPGLLALLAALGFVGRALWRGLAAVPAEREKSEFLALIAPPDDRLLLAGLLGGLAASAVQNLIDSDWYVFFLGVTFWAIAGLAVGMAEAGEERAGEVSADRVRSGLRVAVAVLAALILADAGAQGIAVWEGNAATAALADSDSQAAAQDLRAAMQWDPLNAEYPLRLGDEVEWQREGQAAAAISTLQRAVRLAPASDIDENLARAFAAEHQYPAAIAAMRQGIRTDPVSDISIDLRLDLARLLPPPQSTAYYQQVADLENSPVGRVRAIGQIMPYEFPDADTALGDADYAAHDLAGADRNYVRAATDLEAYVDQGGTTNIQRQVLMGDHPNPALDSQMQELYTHVMQRRIALAVPANKPALQAEAAQYAQKFATVVSHASEPGTP